MKFDVQGNPISEEFYSLLLFTWEWVNTYGIIFASGKYL